MKIDPSEYKILIVDDVVTNVMLLKILLSKEKYNIISASDGHSALLEIEKEVPDLILLDVMMPDMSGYDVAERLNKDDRYKEIPIIFLTALSNTTDVVKGFRVGGNDFISKPFNNEELMIRVYHQISLVAAKRIIIKQTEELRRTIAGRDRLYSVIAHDLRSPIGSIKMVMNMLIMNVSASTIGKDMYELLLQAGCLTEDTFTLLDNLLKWTKSQTGRLKVVYQDFDIVGTVDGVISIFHMMAQTKKIDIKFVNTIKRLLVHADADMIKSVVRNLISNAIKFSDENSSIEVYLEEVDGNAVISVQDHGRGIDEDGQRKLLHIDTHFTTFGTNNEEGSGLGLLLCQDFVENNRGKLWFTSKAGKGSVFYFTVPLVEDKKPLADDGKDESSSQ
ncbi:MAG: hybrid sensor histidine kinase/response regulator [Bacteroidaceae bacterium]|nr:hybrid sensor histidine kinase/response regulator [Bacteroidaceae bacterium]